MKRGDVRWFKFEKPDKNRPVVILTRDSIIPYLGEVTVAPVTSTIRDIPSEVLLDRADGMPRECAINCDHLQTVDKSRIGSLITTLSLSRMREARAAIAFALALKE
jgi:mRNA interferase MazF